jgi:hypothetical protein
MTFRLTQGEVGLGPNSHRPHTPERLPGRVADDEAGVGFLRVQSGRSAGSTFGRVAAFGPRNDEALPPDGFIKLVEFAAPSPDFTDGVGIPSDLTMSLPSGATFTLPSLRVVGGGLAAAGFGLLGAAMRCAESIAGDGERERSRMNPGAVSLVFGGQACVALAEAAGAVSARRAFPGTAARPGASAAAARRLARPWASAGLATAADVFVACAGFVPSAD